jgi:RNA polymerase sigma-70 factor, ECF subfamily
VAGADFEGFDRAHYARLVGQTVAVVGDVHEAEDVVQEAFARASLHWSRVRGYHAPEAWVRRVALNYALSGLRRGRYRRRAVERLGQPNETVPAATAEVVDMVAARAATTPPAATTAASGFSPGRASSAAATAGSPC